MQGCVDVDVDLVRGGLGEELPSKPSCSLEGVGMLSSGAAGDWYCEMPAATAVLVCTHLRKGLECMIILRFLFLGLLSLEMSSLVKSTCAGSLLGEAFAASACWLSLSCSNAAIRWPSALACDQPPYVSGGSYGVGEERCHDLSAASRRAPCLQTVLATRSECGAVKAVERVPGDHYNCGTFCHDPLRMGWFVACSRGEVTAAMGNAVQPLESERERESAGRRREEKKKKKFGINGFATISGPR